MEPTVKTNCSLESRVNKLCRDVYQLQLQGDFKTSKPLCDALFDYGLDDPSFLNMYVLAHSKTGSYEKAFPVAEQLVKQYPDEPRYLNSLALVLLGLRHYEDVITSLDKATSKFPSYHNFHIHLGEALAKEARKGEALLEWLIVSKAESISSTLRSKALGKMASLYLEKDELDKAEEVLEEAIALNPPNSFNLYYLLAQCALKKENMTRVDLLLKELESEADQQESFKIDILKAQRFLQTKNMKKATALLRPWITFLKTKTKDRYWQECLLTLCVFFEQNGETKEKKECYALINTALIQDYDYRYVLSFMQFNKGDLEAAFQNRELRWEGSKLSGAKRKFCCEQWQGQSLTGKKLLIWSEQGIGDVIAFSSVLKDLKDEDTAITIEIIDIQKKLLPVLQLCFPWITFRTFAFENRDCRENPEYKGFDYHIPLGSVFPLLRKTVDDFKQKQKPFIPRQLSLESKIRKELGVKDNELLVGLCWRSSLRDNSRNRVYLNVEDFAPLKDIKGVKFISVQYDEGAEEVRQVQELGLPLMTYDKIDQKDDLLGACGVIGACDLVISVSTAVVPLADGLGVPTLCIGKKGAWTCFGTNSLPMHPSVKYFGEKAGHMARAIPKIMKQWPKILKWAGKTTTSERRLSCR